MVTHSDDETVCLGISIGKKCQPNDVICLFGDLGAGKTTLVKGIVEGVTGIATAVQSPTFSYLNLYSGRQELYHFDLYRLRGADDFLALGFEEYFFMGGVCCIEWAERIMPLLPPNMWRITLAHRKENERTVTIERT